MEANHKDLAAALRARGLTVYGADGGYFLVADSTPLNIPAMQYCRQLVDECGIVCVPLQVFYASPAAPAAPAADGSASGSGGGMDDGLLRFALCKSREYVGQVCERLASKTPFAQ